MKVLIIYPGSETDYPSSFTLLDPERAECLCSCFCENASLIKDIFINSDNFKDLQQYYQEDICCKFINETSYNWEEILERISSRIC